MKVQYKNYVIHTVEEFGKTKFDMYIEESAGHLTLIAVGEYPGKLTKAYCLKELKQTVETIEKIQQQASEIPGRAEG